MKKSLLLVVFMFVSFSGLSQEANPELKQQAIKLIKMSSGAQMQVMIQPLMSRIPEANRAAFKAEVDKSLEGLYTDLADVYLNHYSKEEIDALLDFYNSSIGQKMLEETPEIAQKSMQLGQAWGMQLQPIMQKYQN